MDRSEAERSRVNPRGRASGGPRDGARGRDRRRGEASRSRPAPKPGQPVSDTSIRIGSRSKRLFVVAVAVIVLGFIALALGSTTLAPILLVAGYLVLLPWAIIARDRPAKGSDTSAGEDSPGTGRGSGPGADGDQAEPAS